MIFKKWFPLVLALMLGTSNAYASETRRSSSGICHERNISPYYNKVSTKHTFPNVEACLSSIPNARLPKGVSPSNIKQATQEADDENRAYVQVYDRDLYPHWIDTDKDCQNTRSEILQLRSEVPVTFTNHKRCTVKTGKWFDPYTNQYYTQASDVDIDHLSSLAYSHKRGAHAWSKAKRQAFANDPDNLLIVRNTVNRAKGAKGPTEWMPPHHPYRCTYLKKFVSIMDKYGLAFTDKEQRTITRMTKACND